MKKLLILLFIVIMLPVFSVSNTTDNSFVIKGYYLDTTGNSLLMAVYDNDNNRIYETNVFATDSNVESEGQIFNWKVVGNSNNTVTVSFTFSVFQSYVNGIYYRPAYTIKMYQNPSIVVNNRSDSFYSSAPKTFSYTKASSDYEYVESKVFSYSGSINNNRGNEWTRSGYCTLKISDYERSSGSYEYRCNIRVEFAAQ